jgi:(R,R)-butanediol dehydrogenase / meso-butanediol dehydrogenase / diacetyl reductase
MRAAVYHGPGDIRIESVADPDSPGPGDVVIAVTRAAICGTDSSEWAHGPLLARPPVVLGHEFTGRVIAAGDEVEGVAVGDRVVCGAGISCGACEWCRAGRTNLCASYRTLGLHVDGGLAQYVSSPASICRAVPDGVGDEAAATAQPLAVALHAVRRAGVHAGETCAVIGVGGIGAFVVAGAVARGATVIALDIDADRLATARRLGAERIVDVGDASERRNGGDAVERRSAGEAPADRLAAAILGATSGDGADVVIEASGAPHAPAAALAAAKRGGRVLLVGLQSAPRELDLLAFAVREVDVITTLAHVCDIDLPEALALLSSSDVADVVIDRVIELDDLVEGGIRPLADGSARGKTVVAP